jgi:Thaumatin family
VAKQLATLAGAISRAADFRRAGTNLAANTLAMFQIEGIRNTAVQAQYPRLRRLLAALNGMEAGELPGRAPGEGGRVGGRLRVRVRTVRHRPVLLARAVAPRAACNPAQWPVDYAAVFKQAEPYAYSYADDDATSTYVCKGRCDYRITFGLTPTG